MENWHNVSLFSGIVWTFSVAENPLVTQRRLRIFPKVLLEGRMRQLVNPRTYGVPTIGLALVGCTNRPFYRFIVFKDKKLGRSYEGDTLEQVGAFDPLPNQFNEKLVSLNIERIKYWIGERRCKVTVPALELLGLSGLLPIHPRTFIRARRNRELRAEAEALAAKTAAAAAAEEAAQRAQEADAEAPPATASA